MAAKPIKTGLGTAVFTAPGAIPGDIIVASGTLRLAKSGLTSGVNYVVTGDLYIGNETDSASVVVNTSVWSSFSQTQQLNPLSVLRFSNGGYSATFDTYGSTQIIKGADSQANSSGSVITSTSSSSGLVDFNPGAGEVYSFTGAIKSNHIGKYGLGTQKLLSQTGVGLLETIGNVNVFSGTLSIGDSLLFKATALIVHNRGTFQVEGSTDLNLDFALTGSGKFRWNSTGTAYLNTPTTSFSGPIEIANGVVRIVNSTSFGVGAGHITVLPGATLDLAGYDGNMGNKVLLASGTGFTGLGAIYNSSGTLGSNSIRSLKLLGDTTVNSVLGIGLYETANQLHGGFDMGGHTLTKAGPGFLQLRYSSPVDNPGDILVSAGQLRLTSLTDFGPATTKSITLSPGTQLYLYSLSSRNRYPILAQDGSSIYVTTSTNSWYGNLDVSGVVTIINTSFYIQYGSLSGSGTLIKTESSAAYILGDGTNFTGTIRSDQSNIYIGRNFVDSYENVGASSTTGSVGSSSTLVVNGGQIFYIRTVDSTLSSTLKVYSGTLHINTNSWPVPVSGGNINVTGPVSVYGGTIAINTGSLTLASGSIANDFADRSISIAGGGTLRATGAYTGVQAWIDSAKITVSSAGSLATGSNISTDIDLGLHSALMIGAYADSTVSGKIFPYQNTYLLGGGGATLTVSSALTGARNLTVGTATSGLLSDGAVVLSGTNTYSGVTTVAGGSLFFASSNALSFDADRINITHGGSLVASGAHSGLAAWISSNRINTSSAGALALSSSSTDAIDLTSYASMMIGAVSPSTFSGSYVPGSGGYRFGGGGSTLTVNTALTGSNVLNLGNTTASYGTVVLAGSNTYSGQTNLNWAVLKIASASALGASSSLALNRAGSTLDLNGYSISVPITVAASRVIGIGGNGAIINSSSSPSAVSAPISFGTNPFTVGGTGALTFDRVFGTSASILTKIGSSTLTLNGVTNNSFLNLIVNGGVVILDKASSPTVHAVDVGPVYVTASGTLKLGGSGGDQIEDNVYVYLDNGGVFDLAGMSETIGSLASSTGTLSGKVTNSLASSLSTITLNPGSTNGVFHGVIEDGLGQVAIAKTGNNIMFLAGELTCTGGITVNSGTLTIGHGSNTGSIPSGTLVNVAASGIFGISKLSDYTSDCVVSGEGSLTKTGGGTLTLTGNSSYTGGTTIQLGVLKLGSSSALGGTTGGVTMSGGNLDLNGYSITKGSFTVTNGCDIYNSSAGTTSTLTISSSTDSSFDGTLHDGLGVVALVKSGTNVLTFGGNNYFTGGVTVNSGTLKLSGTLSIPNDANVVVQSGATFDLNGNAPSQPQFGSKSINLTIAGTGDSLNSAPAALTNSNVSNFVQANAGILNLTLSGNATVGGNGGRFDIGRSGGRGSYGAVTTVGGATHTLTKVGTGTVVIRAPSGNVNYVVAGGSLFLEDFGSAGGLSVTVQDTGTLSGYGNIDFTAPLTFETGSTLTSGGSPLQVWSGSVTANGAFTVNTSISSIKVSGAISGSGALTASGTGNYLRLSGDNSNFSGGIITTNSGGLGVDSATALGSGPITFSGTYLNNFSGLPIITTTTNELSLDSNLTFGGTHALTLGSGLTVTLTSNRSIYTSGSDFTLGGEVKGPFSITKYGPGPLYLTNTNSFSGGFTLSSSAGGSSGICAVSANGALGSGPVVSSVMTGGYDGQIRLSGGINLSNSFAITGIGRDQSSPYQYGNILSVSGNNILSGAINAVSGGGGSALGALSGASLDIAGGLFTNEGPRFVSLVGLGTINVSSAIYETNGALQLSVGAISSTNNTGFLCPGYTATTALSGTNIIYTNNTVNLVTGMTVIVGTNVSTITSITANTSILVTPNLSSDASGQQFFAYGFTIGSNVITTPTGLFLSEGVGVSGVGIPPNTTVVSYVTNRSVTLSNPVSANLTGPITLSAPVIPTGNVNLSYTQSTFTGRFNVMGNANVNIGVLGNTGMPSSIGSGSSTPNPSDVLIDGGTLSYTGSSATSTDRLFILGPSSAVLNASGSDPLATLSFTGAPSSIPVSLAVGSGLSGTSILSMPSTTGVIVGQAVSGTGLLPGTRVRSIIENVSVTVNTLLTQDAAGSYTFSNPNYIATDANFDGNRSLTFTGSNVGYNQFAPIITDVTSGFIGTVSVNKTGVGKWVFTGMNTYTGATTISGGTLGLDGSGRIASGGSVSVTGATTNLSIYSPSSSVLSAVTLTDGSISNYGTISSIISNSGTITNEFGGVITSLNVSGANVYNSGTISTLTVSAGSVVSYAGSATTVGTISGIGKMTIYGNTSGNITLNTGATLYGSGSLSGIVANSGSAVSPGDQSNTPFGQLSTSSLNLSGGSFLDIEALDPSSSNSRDSLRFTGSATWPTSNQVNVRIFSCTNTGTRGVSPSFSPNVNYSWRIVVDGNSGSNANKVSLSKFSLDESGWQNSNGVWSILTQASTANASNLDLVLKYVPTNTLIYVTVSSDTFTSTIPAITNILSTDGVEKAGAGKLIFDYNSVYTGGTLVSGGSISLVNGGAIGTGSVVMQSGTTVYHDKTDSAVPNAFAGSGALIKNTSGVSTLSGAVSFDTINVSSGTLRISNSGSVATSTTVAAGGTLSGLSASTIVFGALSVTGSVTNAPSATATTVTINVDGSYSSAPNAVLVASGTVVNSGTMNVGGISTSDTFTSNGSTTATGTISSTSITVNSSGSVASGTLSLNGALSNSGTISVVGSVSVTTSVSQTAGSYSSGSLNNTGSLSLTGGTFTISGSGTIVTGNVSVSDATLSAPLDLPSNKTITLTNGTLNINSIGSTINYASIGGTGSLNMTGSGSAIHAGSLSFGTVGVSSGSLTLNGLITSASGFTKTGTGALTINGSYSYFGTASGSTISGLSSTVGLTSGMSVSGSGVPANTVIQAVGASSVTVSNSLTSGAGTYSFGNAISGTTNINNGVLTIKDVSSLGSGTEQISVLPGGTLNLGGANSADVMNLSGRTVNIRGSGILNSGAITNTSAYTQKNAVSTLVLGANSTIAGTNRWDLRGSSSSSLNLAGYTLTSLSSYTALVNCSVTSGVISVDSGIIELSNLSAGSDVTIRNNSQIYLSGNIATSFLASVDSTGVSTKSYFTTGSASSLGGSFTLGGGTTVISITDYGLTIAGVVSETGSGLLEKTGSNALSLTNTNTWSGGLRIRNGSTIGTASNAFGTGTISFPSDSVGTALLTGGYSFANSVSIGDTGVVSGVPSSSCIQHTGSGLATLSGAVSVNYPISQGGAWQGGATSGDALVFSGAVNVLTSQVAQRSGWVRYSGGGTASSVNILSVSGTAQNGALNGLPKVKYLLGAYSDGVLDLNGYNASVFGIAKDVNSASVTNNGSVDAILTLDAISNITYSGSFVDGTKKVGITKTGSSTLFITGSLTSTGAVVVSAGTVSIPSSATVSSSSSFDVGSSGTLQLTTTTSNVSFGASISGSGVVNLVANTQLGFGSPVSYDLSGNNASFSGSMNLSTLDGDLRGTSRLAVTAASQLGTSTITVPTRTQLFLSNTTVVNNLFISGQGYADSSSITNTPVSVLNFGGPSGLGALRADNSTISGNIRIVGNAKIGNSGGTSTTISGIISATNPWEVLAIGGQGSFDSTVFLTGNNSGLTNLLGIVVVNSGGWVDDTAVRITTLNIGNGGNTGTLGYNGNTQLYADATSGATLRVYRSDGYSLPVSITNSFAGDVTNLINNVSVISDTIGNGWSVSGSIRIASTQTVSGVTTLLGGGTIYVGKTVDGSKLICESGSTIQAGSIKVGSPTAAVSGILTHNGGTTRLFNDLSVGNYPGVISTMNVTGGTLSIEGPAGYFSVGNSAVGVVNHSGGTIRTGSLSIASGTAVIEGGVKSGYYLSGGVLDFTGTNGITTDNPNEVALNLSGGTLRCSAQQNVPVYTDVSISGTGTVIDVKTWGFQLLGSSNIVNGSASITGGGKLSFNTDTSQTTSGSGSFTVSDLGCIGFGGSGTKTFSVPVSGNGRILASAGTTIMTSSNSLSGNAEVEAGATLKVVTETPSSLRPHGQQSIVLKDGATLSVPTGTDQKGRLDVVSLLWLFGTVTINIGG